MATIENIITEDELRKLLGVSKLTMGRLRNEKRLPCLRVTMTRRLYLESDVIDWLISRRVVLNKDDNDAE